MDTTTSSTAAARVFAITELLEHILIYIVKCDPAETSMTYVPQDEEARVEELKELFRLHGVSKTFQDVILWSKARRRAMYLEHTHGSADKAKGLGRLNPIITGLSNFWIEGQSLSGDSDGIKNWISKLALGDLFLPKDSQWPRELLSSSILTPSPASWRKTLIRNAPVSTTFWYGRRRKFIWPKGATVGEMVDTLVEVLLEETQRTEKRVAFFQTLPFQACLMEGEYRNISFQHA